MAGKKKYPDTDETSVDELFFPDDEKYAKNVKTAKRRTKKRKKKLDEAMDDAVTEVDLDDDEAWDGIGR